MADGPTASISRAGRCKMRSISVHLPMGIPVASKAAKTRSKSVQKPQVKCKGKGDKKKSGKAAKAISSESEDSEVDFPHLAPNQPLDVPVGEPEQPEKQNQPLDIPAEVPEEQNQPLDIPAEGREEPEEQNQPLDAC